MGNHQQHHRDERNGASSRRGNQSWQDESRDSQGRFQSGNWGSSDSDGQNEDDGDDRAMRGSREQERGGHDREGGQGRYGASMSSGDRSNERYEADYGYPQSDRGSRWNESGRGRDQERDGGRGYGIHDSSQRGRDGSNGEEMYGSRERYGDDRSSRGMQRDEYGRFERSGSGGGHETDGQQRSGGRSWSEDRGSHTGQHVGKGPKGYRRPDERVEEDVNEALSRHGDIDASEIEVSVKDGDVTLSGTVDDRETKRRAEECVENCSGVNNVQNNLRVSSAAKHGDGSHAESGSRSGSAGKSSANGSNSNASGSNANSTSGKSNSTH